MKILYNVISRSCLFTLGSIEVFGEIKVKLFKCEFNICENNI